MKQCPYCGSELNDDAKFCGECGKPLPEEAPLRTEVPAEPVEAEPAAAVPAEARAGAQAEAPVAVQAAGPAAAEAPAGAEA